MSRSCIVGRSWIGWIILRKILPFPHYHFGPRRAGCSSSSASIPMSLRPQPSALPGLQTSRPLCRYAYSAPLELHASTSPHLHRASYSFPYLHVATSSPQSPYLQPPHRYTYRSPPELQSPSATPRRSIYTLVSHLHPSIPPCSDVSTPTASLLNPTSIPPRRYSYSEPPDLHASRPRHLHVYTPSTRLPELQSSTPSSLHIATPTSSLHTFMSSMLPRRYTYSTPPYLHSSTLLRLQRVCSALMAHTSTSLLSSAPLELHISMLPLEMAKIITETEYNHRK